MVLRQGKLFTLSLAVIVLVLAGCSGRVADWSGRANVVINSSMKELGLGTNVASVVLRVSGSGFEAFEVTGIIVDGRVVFELEVPLGDDRLFEMRAVDNEGTTLYQGAETADVQPGQTTSVDILMQPIVPMIRITPMFRRITATQGTARFDVQVFNVDSLFGVSFRVEYDTNIIAITQVSQGRIFGAAPTLFFERRELNYVAIGQTLLNNGSPQGVDGVGTSASVNFIPRANGTTVLRLNRATVKLSDWQGNTLPRTGRLYIEDGEVEIVAP